MIALVAKDLRIALTALRPLAIVIAGMLLGTMVLGVLPHGSIEFLPRLSVIEVARGIGWILILGGALPAAWTTSSILLGDRVHHAAGLAATLPIPRSWRCVAWTCACLACYAGVILASFAIQEDRPLEGLGLATIPWVLGVSASAWCTRIVARPLRATVLTAIVVAVVLGTAVGMGRVGSSLASRWIDQGAVGFLPHGTGTLESIAASAWTTGTVTACLTAALAFLVTAAAPPLLGRRPLRLGSTLASVWVLTSLVAGTVAMWTMVSAPDVLRATDSSAQVKSVAALTDDELLVEFREFLALRSEVQAWEQRNLGSRHGAVANEVARRLQSMDEASVDASLLADEALAHANNPRDWDGGRWLRQAMRSGGRSDDVSVRWSLLFAETAATMNRAALQAEMMNLIHKLLREELGPDAASSEFNDLIQLPPQERPFADYLDRFAAKGHRYAERLRALAAHFRPNGGHR